MSTDYPIVTITTQPIELCKLLKIANMVAGGGEAKIVISEGYVYLNGEVEFQKRKKVYENDVVEFNGEVIQVACIPEKTLNTPQTAPTRSKNKKSTTKKVNTQVEVATPVTPSKRNQ